MIRLDFANILTIALAGAFGYGVLVGGVKIWQMIQGAQSGTVQ